MGFEADISFNYAEARKKSPKKFDTRWKNKMQWVFKGAGGFCTSKLNDRIEVFVDGEPVKLPKGTRSVVVCNIQSISDGMNFWGSGSSKKKDAKGTDEPSLGDGKMEVIRFCLFSRSHPRE